MVEWFSRDPKNLSLRAVVAYAARCARRVQPLFVSHQQEHVDSVERAIDVAEKFAAFGVTAATATATAARAAVPRAANAADVASAAAYAANAAYAATNAAIAADSAAESLASAAAIAAESAAESAAARAATTTSDRAAAANAATNAAIAAAKSDYRKLLALGPEPAPALGEPIDFEALGPLWPEGEPEWFEKAKARAGVQIHATTAKLTLETHKAEISTLQIPDPIEIYLDPGNASKETIQEVLEAISDLHRAAGGLGLDFEIDGHFVLATEEVAQ